MRKRCLAVVLSGLLIMAAPSSSWASQPQPGFADVSGHWAERVILDITDRGLMQGVGVNAEGLRLFAPEMQVSRAQAAVVLMHTFQLGYGSKVFIKQPLASDYYRDIDNQAWYASAASICAINQVFPSSDHFYPDQSISRWEMAQAVQRCFTAKGISVPMIMSMPVYKDMEGLSNDQVNAVAFVTNTAIMSGYGQYFRPQDPISRAEMAQILEGCLLIINRQAAVDESYNGKEYRTQAGQSFGLSLTSNPTTGYEWQLSDSYDKNILKVLNSYYQAPAPTNPPIVGQGGRQYWQFTALQAGTTELTLTYSRPWESVQPAQTFTIKIKVDKSAESVSGLTFTTKAVKNESPEMVVDMKVPVASGINDSSVQSAINSRWSADADSFVQNVSSGLSEYLKERADNNAPANPFGANSEYTICCSNENFLSMYVDYYQYTGGAHGGTERRAYNIDLKTGKALALSDLFKAGFDYKTIIDKTVQKQIDADPETYFEGEGGFKGITSNQGCYVKDNNLVVYFQQYEIAAYAVGIPEFKIPLDQLQAGLNIAL